MCRLCSNFNAAHKQNIDSHHPAWVTTCPVYQEVLKHCKQTYSLHPFQIFGYVIIQSLIKSLIVIFRILGIYVPRLLIHSIFHYTVIFVSLRLWRLGRTILCMMMSCLLFTDIVIVKLKLRFYIYFTSLMYISFLFLIF